ncbi:MAG: peptide ABC transporter substrate-binding protein [Clostridia bacterium]|nr:peptide ABC transporter substrate-binding protein [Clostridia bacterium]
MLKKSLCFILCLLFVITCFSACGEKKGSEAALVYPIDSDPEYLDPQIISHTGAKNIIANCFEGLVTVGEDGEIAPGCAESWSVSPDGLTYTFNLRKDCKWRVSIYASPLLGLDSSQTNSKPVTAYDFDFGITRALLPETKSPGAASLLAIKNASEVNSGKLSSKHLGVTATDEYTLEITLEHNDPDFLYALLQSACMPCNEEFFEATGGRYGLAVKYLIYNGPFYINNWVDDVSLSIRKNDYYYDSKAVMPRSVYFSILDEQQTRLSKLKDKTYSVSPLTKAQANEIADNKKYTVKAFDSAMTCFIFNCSDPILSNMNIRRALASSFDYASLESAMGNITAKGIVPSAMKISSLKYRESASSVTLYQNEDPAALFKKGLDQLDISSAELTVLCSEENEAAVRKLMQSWQASLGINCAVFVESVSDTELIKRVASKNYQLALTTVAYHSDTAFNILSRYKSDSADNIIGLHSKTYDSLVDSIKLAEGVTQSISAAEKCEKYLVSAAAIIPLYEEPVYFGLGKGVSGTYWCTCGDIVYFKHTLSK